MFCVIQKIQRKNPDTNGHAKELLVETDTFIVDGEEITEYGYRYGDERFERPKI